MFFGFLAIIETMQGNFAAAGWLIIIAGILDGFDGKLARYLKKGSKFGIEFDSIADMVSFGVAPAILIYFALLQELGFPGLVLSFSITLFGGFRLARFNLIANTTGKDVFVGLPIPITAITTASYIHFSWELNGGFNPVVLAVPLVVLLSLLMVSGITYDTFPRFSKNEGSMNKAKLLFLGCSIILICIWPGYAVFLLSLFFIAQGILRSIVKSVRKPALDNRIHH